MRAALNQKWHKEVMPERWSHSMRSNFISHIHIGTTEQANAHEKYNSFFLVGKRKPMHMNTCLSWQKCWRLFSAELAWRLYVFFLIKWSYQWYSLYLIFLTKLQGLVASEDFADLFRYNILPLHPRSSQKPIMLLPEVCLFFYSKLSKAPVCPVLHYTFNFQYDIMG